MIRLSFYPKLGTRWNLLLMVPPTPSRPSSFLILCRNFDIGGHYYCCVHPPLRAPTGLSGAGSTSLPVTASLHSFRPGQRVPSACSARASLSRSTAPCAIVLPADALRNERMVEGRLLLCSSSQRETKLRYYCVTVTPNGPCGASARPSNFPTLSNRLRGSFRLSCSHNVATTTIRRYGLVRAPNYTLCDVVQRRRNGVWRR